MYSSNDIVCPWCNKPCDDIDLDGVLEEGWSYEVACGYCDERFIVTVDVSLDFSTEKISTIQFETGDKVCIDGDPAKTGGIITKKENGYEVFIDQTRTTEVIDIKRLTKAPGVWVNPDQLAIPFNMETQNT